MYEEKEGERMALTYIIYFNINSHTNRSTRKIRLFLYIAFRIFRYIRKGRVDRIVFVITDHYCHTVRL